MARKYIQRKMISSTINAFKLEVVDGQPKAEQIETITVTGKVNEKTALKILKEKYGKEVALTISSIDELEEMYEISVDDFMKHARKVENVSRETSETGNDEN